MKILGNYRFWGEFKGAKFISRRLDSMVGGKNKK
jgi:hypothetical protein